MKTLSQGAEATIYQDGDVIYKKRSVKTYRHPSIDARLRKARAKREKKILEKSVQLGIRTPSLEPCEEITTLKMAYINGSRLRDVLLAQPYRTEELNQLGKWVATLHNEGIIHGDLTTSNVLVDSKGPVLIDFGLAFFSTKDEDRAVDIHVLEQALESTHPTSHKQLINAFLDGYKTAPFYDVIIKRLQTVRSRGRNKHE